MLLIRWGLFYIGHPVHTTIINIYIFMVQDNNIQYFVKYPQDYHLVFTRGLFIIVINNTGSSVSVRRVKLKYAQVLTLNLLVGFAADY